MKVLHVATGFKVSFPGGITNYVRTLARSQAEGGGQVHILARPEEDNFSIPNVVLHPYTPSKTVPFSLRNQLSDPAEREVVELIRAGGFDLIHFHMALDFSSTFLQSFERLGVPYCISLHDYFYICPRIFMIDWKSDVCHHIDLSKCQKCVGLVDQIDFFRKAARRLDITLPRIESHVAVDRLNAMRSFLEKANLVLAVSTRTADIYREVAPGARIVVEQIGNDSASIEVAKKKPSKTIRIVALSVLSRHKGADILGEIMSRVNRPDIEFHFYGRTADGCERSLTRMGLQCHGSYKSSDIPEIMSNADLGVVLSIWEDAGPQAAMEFINNKVPVLGTKRGGIPDIVAPGSGFLFDPADGDEIRKAVDWLQNISLQEIQRMSAEIQRLKTPEEHKLNIDKRYKEMFSSRS